MKTSLKKLQKFAALRHEKRGLKHHKSLALDDLARATQDMNDMRDCYDRLLSAAAATANSVYEFSESLKEMGDCLLEKTSLNDDEEGGKVLLMLGKVQFELQKLVDGYRSHIFQTITIPSESLLNELHIVEEMKRRCDGKREIYEDLMKKQKEKGRLRSSKGECFSSHQLQSAHDEYDEEANVFVFRMKSLKQGQSRSLLTQASRHHAAQMCFFKKALSSLEAIEPHVKLVSEKHHIDYQFSGLKDDYGSEMDEDDDESDDEDDDSADGPDTHDDGELSFDYGRNSPVPEVSKVKYSMELDNNADAKFSLDPKSTAAKFQETFRPSLIRNSFSFRRDNKALSKSAPLFPEKKLDTSDHPNPHMRPTPSYKFTSYVLPTPDQTKSSPVSGKLDSTQKNPRQEVTTPNLWHSSPLDQNKYEKIRAHEKSSGPIILDTQSVLKESNNNNNNNVPPPSLEGLSFKHSKKVKRHAFSGPLTGKSWPNNHSGPFVSSSGYPSFSGSLLHTPLPPPTSTPKLSNTFVSSPKISELHELPRPPPHLAAKRPSGRINHSGPLISRSPGMSSSHVSTKSVAGSTLPKPPQTISRSYSIPAGGALEATMHAAAGDHHDLKMAEDVGSPTLMPISLVNIKPASPKS